MMTRKRMTKLTPSQVMAQAKACRLDEYDDRPKLTMKLHRLLSVVQQKKVHGSKRSKGWSYYIKRRCIRVIRKNLYRTSARERVRWKAMSEAKWSTDDEAKHSQWVSSLTGARCMPWKTLTISLSVRKRFSVKQPLPADHESDKMQLELEELFGSYHYDHETGYLTHPDGTVTDDDGNVVG